MFCVACYYMPKYCASAHSGSRLFSTVCRDLFFLQLVLELCRGDGVSNLQMIQSQLDKIHTCSVELSSNQEMVGVFKDNLELFHHQI